LHFYLVRFTYLEKELFGFKGDDLDVLDQLEVDREFDVAEDTETFLEKQILYIKKEMP
jgi:hypothetical protein